MNLKRFTGRTSRDAMQKVKLSFGNEAIVLSTKPCPQGVEIIAMAADGMSRIERQVPAAVEYEPPAPAPTQIEPARPMPLPDWAAAEEDRYTPSSRPSHSAAAADVETSHTSVQEDVRRLGMSTLSFQEYVRERMLKRRTQAAKSKSTPAKAGGSNEPRTEPSFSADASAPAPAEAPTRQALPATTSVEDLSLAAMGGARLDASATAAASKRSAGVDLSATASAMSNAMQAFLPSKSAPVVASVPVPAPTTAPTTAPTQAANPAGIQTKLADMPRPVQEAPASLAEPLAEMSVAAASSRVRAPSPMQASAAIGVDMVNELREMKDLIEERFGAMAFMQRLQRSPAQATVSQKLLECGFSPALVRKLIDGMPDDIKDGSQDPLQWSTRVLERNLSAAEKEIPIEDQTGVFALIGPTGAGKTTSTAKIAAAFAAKHGAQQLGLITLDAYRVGAHEQLRAYGRILGVPVHTAHDRVALEDLLDLLSAKRLVLIDTAGIAQRDVRTKELLDMLSHRSIQRLLVINAATQGETIEDVINAYRGASTKGVVLSKLDEAVKLAPALDALIRHRLCVLGVANGQRVPEDWHRFTNSTLLQRAFKCAASAAYRLDTEDLNLIFALSSSHGASNDGSHIHAA